MSPRFLVHSWQSGANMLLTPAPGLGCWSGEAGSNTGEVLSPFPSCVPVIKVAERQVVGLPRSTSRSHLRGSVIFFLLV